MLLDPAHKETNKSEPELMLSEVITTILQAEAAYVGLSEDDFAERLGTQCAEHGLAVPTLSAEEVRHLRTLRDDYQGWWSELAAGETIEVELRRRT